MIWSFAFFVFKVKNLENQFVESCTSKLVQTKAIRKHCRNVVCCLSRSTQTLLQMSLPHGRQTGLGALWRWLWPRPTRGNVSTAALSVVLHLSLRVCQGYNPLLPACLHLSVRLLFGGQNVAVIPSICGGIRDGGCSVSVVCHFDVTGAAPIRVLDFCPDAAVHHADQVCGLDKDKKTQR